MREQRGQGSGEYAGVLVVIAAIFVAVATTDLGHRVTGRVSDAVCTIAGGDCAETAAESDGPRIQTAASGPPLAGGDDMSILPFPGSISVSCSGGTGSDQLCKGGKGTTSVSGNGTVTVDRSQTRLDSKGCPAQTASVSTTLKLEGSASTPKPEEPKPRKSGAVSKFLGHKLNYSVSAAPDQMDAMAQGRRQTPNPLDPLSIHAGESVQMSEEFYEGVGMSAKYRALQASLGYDRGRRVSAGARRLPGNQVRVYVGDEDFVRNAMTVGLGNDEAHVDVGFNQEVSDGKLRAVDIDISTPEGWNAYQQFVTSGKVPGNGSAGTSSPTSSTTHKLSKSATLSATYDDLKLGGMLTDAEGNYTETKDENGNVTTRNLNVRYKGVGIEVEDADGARTYGLNLEDVDPEKFENFQGLNFGDTHPPADGNVRMDFTAGDLMGMRRQALEQIAQQMERRGVDPRPSAEEVADNLERNHGVIKVGGQEYTPEGAAAVLATKDTPEGVLEGLYRLANGDPNGFLTGPMTDFILRTNYAHGNQNPTERGRLPGEVHGPKCAH
jgi:hypothetical protein